ncbi:MAG: MotA/TolQ/ExbB proton channel family protein [Actinomycetota bacterium]|nr:MotA/TolQ/ExbB proton channel family protein [Actinomycetota bacterium]
MILIFGLSSHDVDQVIFHVASALQVPVLLLALLALALVIFELGSYAIEVRGRRSRHFSTLSQAALRARVALLANDRKAAAAAVDGVARSPEMAYTLDFITEHARTDGGEHQVNKALADFDFEAQRRLGRTRMLVRAGPALGLMGTLIPLSPALTGLAKGDTATLSNDLRIAFSVTVVGLLIGAVAFALSLSRDRMYGQDLSDIEYVAAVVSDPGPAVGDSGPPPTAGPPSAISEPPPVGGRA